jgi:hypothetical protein
MCFGPSEVSHDAIAEVLRDMTAEPAYRLGCRAVIGSYDLAPFFGVELGGEVG